MTFTFELNKLTWAPKGSVYNTGKICKLKGIELLDNIDYPHLILELKDDLYGEISIKITRNEVVYTSNFQLDNLIIFDILKKANYQCTKWYFNYKFNELHKINFYTQDPLLGGYNINSSDYMHVNWFKVDLSYNLDNSGFMKTFLSLWKQADLCNKYIDLNWIRIGNICNINIIKNSMESAERLGIFFITLKFSIMLWRLDKFSSGREKIHTPEYVRFKSLITSNKDYFWRFLMEEFNEDKLKYPHY